MNDNSGGALRHQPGSAFTDYPPAPGRTSATHRLNDRRLIINSAVYLNSSQFQPFNRFAPFQPLLEKDE
jgi:hypothetical protein